jgi:Tfp pilus assembly protein PilV
MKNIQKKINLHSSGFTLMETLIAAMILIVVSAGVVVLTFLNLRNAVINKHRLQATWLAQQGVEGLRQIRDTHWIDSVATNYWDTDDNNLKNISPSVKGINYDTTDGWTISSSSNTFTDALISSSTDIFFTRTISIVKDTTSPENNIIITVAVTWNDYGHPRDATVKTKLTNWRKY